MGLNPDSSALFFFYYFFYLDLIRSFHLEISIAVCLASNFNLCLLVVRDHHYVICLRATFTLCVCVRMRMCVCVCVCVYIHGCMCAFIHSCTCMCMCAFMCMCLCVCVWRGGGVCDRVENCLKHMKSPRLVSVFRPVSLCIWVYSKFCSWLVSFISIWQKATRHCEWFKIIRNTFRLWRSPGISAWSCSIYPVHHPADSAYWLTFRPSRNLCWRNPTQPLWLPF